MVNNSAIYNETDLSVTDDLSCRSSIYGFNSTSEGTKHTKDGEFLWTPATQGIILGSFYYGYCCFQIIGGRLAEIYSGKLVFAVGTFLASIMAILTPLAAWHSVTAIVLVRVLQGVSQSAMLPSLYTVFSNWFPDFERGTLGAVVGSGLSIGTLTGMSISGLLCNSDLFNGWPSVFYLFGFLNCLMAIFWCMLVTNSPTTHPLITENELKYIISNQRSDMNTQVPPLPWLKVLTSIPFIALIITQNGILSSIPFPIKAVIAITVGFTSNLLLRKGYATVNFIRKFCTVFPFLWFSAGLVGVCLAGCNAVLSTIFFICSVPIIGFAVCGYNINHLDLSPEYAGTLYGISNTFSSMMGFLAPMFVGYITNEHQSFQEWYTVFGTVIAVLLFSSVIFSVFGSTKKQNWIDTEPEVKAIKQTLICYNTLKQT
ncbi:sialin-like isoform X2 [Parasteatoda tepidariorum]|uniref:sialin-like isoform X2 n=1 Tax=Parasteatoda tepidariorum TaxID=114398 RepID=UPI0039BC4DD6